MEIILIAAGIVIALAVIVLGWLIRAATVECPRATAAAKNRHE